MKSYTFFLFCMEGIFSRWRGCLLSFSYKRPQLYLLCGNFDVLIGYVAHKQTYSRDTQRHITTKTQNLCGRYNIFTCCKKRNTESYLWLWLCSLFSFFPTRPIWLCVWRETREACLLLKTKTNQTDECRGLGSTPKQIRFCSIRMCGPALSGQSKLSSHTWSHVPHTYLNRYPPSAVDLFLFSALDSINTEKKFFFVILFQLRVGSTHERR